MVARGLLVGAAVGGGAGVGGGATVGTPPGASSTRNAATQAPVLNRYQSPPADCPTTVTAWPAAALPTTGKFVPGPERRFAELLIVAPTDMGVFAGVGGGVVAVAVGCGVAVGVTATVVVTAVVIVIVGTGKVKTTGNSKRASSGL